MMCDRVCLIVTVFLASAAPFQRALAEQGERLNEATTQPSAGLWVLLGLIAALGLWWRFERAKMRARSQEHRDTEAASRGLQPRGRSHAKEKRGDRQLGPN